MSTTDKTKLDGFPSKNNSTTQFLRGDGTWQVPPDTKYNNATTSAAGLMSSTDKSKLDGIAANANNYSLPTASASTLGGIKVGSGLSISNGVLSSTVSGGSSYTLPAASSSTLGGVKIGSNITNSNGTISLSSANVTNALGFSPAESSSSGVTGVKGDSETSYRTGNVNITKANIGLGNVDNTADSVKIVATAKQLYIKEVLRNVNLNEVYSETAQCLTYFQIDGASCTNIPVEFYDGSNAGAGMLIDCRAATNYGEHAQIFMTSRNGSKISTYMFFRTRGNSSSRPWSDWKEIQFVS